MLRPAWREPVLAVHSKAGSRRKDGSGKGDGLSDSMRCEICKRKVPKDCTICVECCWEREFEIVEREFIEQKGLIVASWSKPVRAPVCRKRNAHSVPSEE